MYIIYDNRYKEYVIKQNSETNAAAFGSCLDEALKFKNKKDCNEILEHYKNYPYLEVIKYETALMTQIL